MKTDDHNQPVPRLEGWWLVAGGWRRAGYAVLVSVDQPGLRPLPPGKGRMIEAALDNLARVLGEDCAWMLTGGLSIAAAMGRFYRDHDDFDIAVHQDELARLVAVAESHGYGLFCRLGATRISPTRRITLYRRMSPEHAACNWHRRFRLLRVGAGGWRTAPLALSDFMDVYTYHHSGEWVVSNGSDMRVPAAGHEGGFYTTTSGRKVPLRGTVYMEQIKRLRSGEKDQCDLDMMRQQGLIG